MVRIRGTKKRLMGAKISMENLRGAKIFLENLRGMKNFHNFPKNTPTVPSLPTLISANAKMFCVNGKYIAEYNVLLYRLPDCVLPFPSGGVENV